MSICRVCGADVPESQKFCHSCGEVLLESSDEHNSKKVSAPDIALDKTLSTAPPNITAAAKVVNPTTPTVTLCANCETGLPPGETFCVACGHSNAPDSTHRDSLLGITLVDNFRIEALLGEGAMGRVYRARQISLDKVVAIKVLHPHLAGDRNIARRFHREARAASRLNHPNSLHIIDFGQTDDHTLYIAMEYIEGPDLHEIVCDDFPLSLERIVNLVGQVCLALDEAHAAGIVHRDLKPENIMMIRRRDGREEIKVCDFGIAKIQETGDSNTSAPITVAGIVCGTPEYMSPEQCRGEALDGRADIYSVGVILYQMITNVLPFVADSPLGVVTRQLTDEPVRPTLIQDQSPVASALEPIVLKALIKDREFRYRTALDLKVDLDRVLTGGEIAPPPAMQIEPAPSTSARTTSARAPAARWPVVIGASVAAGLAAFLGVWFLTPGLDDRDSTSPLDAHVSGDTAPPTDAMTPRSDGGSTKTAPQVVVSDASDASDASALVDATAPSTKADPDANRFRRKTSPQGRRTKVAKVRPTPPPREPEGAPQKSAFQLGRDAFRAGNITSAISHFERARQGSPGNPAVHQMLGKCYFRVGRTAQGRAAYQRYLQLRPNAPDRPFVEGIIGN